MNINNKNIALLLILLFAVYCALTIGIHWDATLHLQQGKNKLDYIYSLGQVKNEFSFSGYFPGVSYTISAFIVSLFPKKFEFESLHLITLLISLSAIYGTSKIVRILFNKKISNLVFILFILYPVYFGHMSMNPKDPLTATTFVWIIYLILKYFKSINKDKKNTYVVKIGILLAIGSGVRLFFPVIFAPVFFFLISDLLIFKKIIKNFIFKEILVDVFKILLIFYFILILFWPQVHSNILTEPFAIITDMFTRNEEKQASWDLPIMLNGIIYLGADKPKEYLLINLFYKTPEYLLLLYISAPYILIRYNKFFVKKIINFNYHLSLVLITLILTYLLTVISPFPLYDGMRLFLYIIPFLLIIPGLVIYFILNNLNFFYYRLFLVFIAFLFSISIYKFISLTPYHYVYLNYFTGQTEHNSKKFENDYLGVSIKELIKKSNFLNEKNGTRLAICGVDQVNVKYYLKKYNYFKVRIVRPEENYDYVLMTNRVNWAIQEKDKQKTCFKSFDGEIKSFVSRNSLNISLIKSK